MDSQNPDSSHAGAWAQQWNCGTADCGNATEKIDLVRHPWYPNAMQPWSSRRFDGTTFANIPINEFYDTVQMTQTVSQQMRKLLKDNNISRNGDYSVMKCITSSTQQKALYLQDRLNNEAAGHL